MENSPHSAELDLTELVQEPVKSRTITNVNSDLTYTMDDLPHTHSSALVLRQLPWKFSQSVRS